MHQTIEAVYDNGEFVLEELPPIRKVRVFITFVQEIEDNAKGKIKFPTKKLGKIKNLERGDFYGEFLSESTVLTGDVLPSNKVTDVN